MECANTFGRAANGLSHPDRQNGIDLLLITEAHRMPAPQNTAPTLRKIAQATGYSLSTVSSALRDQPGVASKTVRTIKAAALSMGWRPNPLVSAWLSHVRSGRDAQHDTTLAYVISAPSGIDHFHRESDTYRAYYRGAAARAEALGFKLEVFHYESFGGERLSDILYSRGIPGVIIAPKEDWNASLELDWEQFSLATIAYSIDQPVLSRAANHHFQTTFLAVKKLNERGYRRYGLVIDEGLEQRSNNMFTGGYWSAAHKLSETPIKPFLYPDGSFDSEAFRSWLKDKRPDVIMSFDYMRRRLEGAGLKIPREIGFVDLDWCPRRPELAGIDQSPERIGAAAVDLVSAQIYRNERGIPTHPKLSLIESRWVDGASAPAKIPGVEKPKFDSKAGKIALKT